MALKLGNDRRASKRLRALNQESINMFAPVLGPLLDWYEPCDRGLSREADAAVGNGSFLVIELADVSLSQ